jgi:hypothetical protein
LVPFTHRRLKPHTFDITRHEMTQSLSLKRLSVEQLEDRVTPSWGVPWFDGSSLTLSFVPDGTDISGKASNLFSALGANSSQAQWKGEILRAYQTWAVQSNLNIGLVNDGGQPMGVAGAPQEDIRFGDIRVGARPLSAAPASTASMAGAVGFDYNSKTWAGDLVFNSQYQFGIGDTPGQQSDLFSVALHEAAHSFGLSDQNTDPTSVLYARYQGIYNALALTDTLALRAMYGIRSNDAYEGLLGNGTELTAFNLTSNGNLTAINADVTQLGDVDIYKIVTPSSLTGVTGLTINLRAAGISLLTSRLTVLDALGNTVATTATSDPTNNNLSLTLPNYHASSTYYVKVQGSGTDVFSIGAYVLKLNYSPYNPAGTNADTTNAYYTNIEAGSHLTLATAQTLTPVRATKANTFVLAGYLSSPTNTDWYRITPTAPIGFSGTLFVGTMTTTNGLYPTVAIYGSNGQQLPAVVTQSDNGSFEVQLAGATTGTTYYVRVAAADPTGAHATGIYTLGATLSPVGPTQFESIGSDSLTTSTATQYSTMTVTGDRLTQFALNATGGSTTATTAVRMTLFDATGRAVFTTVALAGQPLSTGAVWLGSGTYTVVFNAATRDGSSLQTLAVDVAARTLSDPIDPYVIDPTETPPPPPVVIDIPVPTPPPAVPIVDPITDPFLGLFTYP